METEKTFYYYKCWHCKKITYPEGKYCPYCGKDLFINDKGQNTSLTHMSDTDLNLPRFNIIEKDFSCQKCKMYLRCEHCFSFGMLQKNDSGFGGIDCDKKNDSIKCVCCQSFIKCYTDIFNNIDITNLSKDLFTEKHKFFIKKINEVLNKIKDF